MKSKDPSTRVGAVIVGPNNEVRSTGYNGFSRGVNDDQERYRNKVFKHYACNHAEENAILHCARIGIAAEGCILYTTWLPCSYCAKAIIQTGISAVVYHDAFPGTHGSETWGESMAISRKIFEEAGVSLRGFNGNLITISGLYNSNIFSIYDIHCN